MDEPRVIHTACLPQPCPVKVELEKLAERVDDLEAQHQDQRVVNTELRMTTQSIKQGMDEMNDNLKAIAVNVQNLTVAMSASEAVARVKRKAAGAGIDLNRVMLILVITLSVALLLVLGLDIKDIFKVIGG